MSNFNESIDGRDLQIIVSPLTLTSLARTLNKKQITDLQIDKQVLVDSVQNFDKVFKNPKTFDYVLTFNPDLPANVSLNKQGKIIISVAFIMSVKNPYN